MSCNIAKKSSSSSIEGFDKLLKHFDIVEIVEHEKYARLVCKDFASRKNITFSVWLDLKIKKNVVPSAKFYSVRTNKEYIEMCVSDVLKWINLLKRPHVDNQLSLFGEIKETAIIDESLMVTDYSKYLALRDKANKEKILNNYEFFDVFDDCYSTWTYCEIEYESKLPNDDEMLNLLKHEILNHENKDGTHGLFQPEYFKIEENKPIGDYELYQRILNGIRLEIMPFKRYKHSFTDNSYQIWDSQESMYARFVLIRGEISSSGYGVSSNFLPRKISFFNEEFISWLRGIYKCPNKEMIPDEEALKCGIISMFRHALWWKADEYNLKEEVTKFSDYKKFKAAFLAYLKSNNIDSNGGGASSVEDGFSYRYDCDKYSVTIYQKVEARLHAERDVDDDKDDFYENVVVYELEDNKLFEKTFELFGRKQVSLFDFL